MFDLFSIGLTAREMALPADRARTRWPAMAAACALIPMLASLAQAATPPPADATFCGRERQTCTVPNGKQATAWYGTDTRWNAKTGLAGSFTCDNATFGDPAALAAKSCFYAVTGNATPPSQVKAPSTQYTSGSFVNFETPHVYPLERTPDGRQLLAVNTADGTLMMFGLETGRPVQRGAVAVGMDPVTVRARNSTEAWVVNRVSGTISIVDLTRQVVTSTVEVCHAPGDVVFAQNGAKAVASCTRPNLLVTLDTTTRVKLASVVVAGESPRALELSRDGGTVYAAIFESGNSSTVLVGDNSDFRINNVTNLGNGPWRGVTPVPNNPAYLAGVPGASKFLPAENPANPNPPQVSAIVAKTSDGWYSNSVVCGKAVFGDPLPGTVKSCQVQDPQTLAWTHCATEGSACTFTGRRQVRYGANGIYSTGRWRDDMNGDWTSIVAGKDAGQSNRVANWDLPDRDVAIYNVATGAISYQTRLMNSLMAISVNPANGKVYTVGTEATNLTRFEPILNGVFLRVNMASFVPGQAPLITDLNPHLTYAASSVPLSQRAQSFGDPRGIAWNAAGTSGFVTGMGSNHLLKVDAAGTRQGLLKVGQGPTGVVVDDGRNQVYVLNKFDGTISVVNAGSLTALATVPFFDPTPREIASGRPFLYDTLIGSGNGHVACASCHIDGRTDRLSWDLGNPAGPMESRNGFQFHPMKGPLVTQSLQNIIGSPSLHHRGDRKDLFGFAGAFFSLQGTAAPLDDVSMALFEGFLARVAFPPNPNRDLDNSFGSAVALPGPLGTVRKYADAAAGQAENCTGSCHPGSRLRGDVQGANPLHNSQPMIPESLQGLFERLGLFWQSVNGSTVGTGVRTQGAHDSTFANEGTSDNTLAFMLSSEGPRDGLADRSANAHGGVGVQATMTAAGADQKRGTPCAAENGICSFTGTREVIFGTAQVFVSGVFTGGAACTAQAFGVDPAPGQLKTCAVRGALLTMCAAENAVCPVSEMTEIFYGSGNGRAFSKVTRVNTRCGNGVFGDPRNGTRKSCYARPASEFARVAALLGIADTGKVGLVYNTADALGKPESGYYVGQGMFQTDSIGVNATLEDLYARAAGSGVPMQLMLVARGTEYRIGADANLDGTLNGDARAVGQDPRGASIGGWAPCATEGSTCAFSGVRVVRYGAPGNYLYGVFRNGVSCGSAVWGDPKPGVAKSCDSAI